MMARVTEIRRPGDYPGTPDEATREGLAELFAGLFPGKDDPAIDDAHTAIAIAAHNPRMALMMARLTGHIATQTLFGQRTDLRELAILAINLHFKSTFAFEARFPNVATAGLTGEQMAAVPYWRTTSLFDEEQRLTIEYALAAASGEVAEELFARAKACFGEKGVVELTAVAGMWSFWAMLINATRPAFSRG